MTSSIVQCVCLGEMLIDFVSTETGITLANAPAFEKKAGGAPANVAVGLSRLGVTCAFMGKVGHDEFGHFLARTLEQNGVDTVSLRFSQQARTALAFVSLAPGGERDFMFYRHPSADMLFEPGEVDEDIIRNAQMLHFGSITLIDEPVRSATLHALEVARKAGLTISYDPNLRLNLWPDADAARAGMLLGMPYASIVKVSGEELGFLTDTEDFEESVRRLWHDDLNLLVVTDGPHGCRYATRIYQGQVSGFNVETIDTTGAGDGFVAGLLHELLEHEAVLSDVKRLEDALRFANAVGALTTTRRGAIPALPTFEQIEQLMTLA